MTSDLKSLVQRFLADRPHQSGETVQCGWFVFRIAKSGSTPEVESLDMKRIASFTTDFTEAERIYRMQNEILNRYQVDASDCTLRHSALVSKNYSPGDPRTFLKHDPSSGGTDSGWYIGIHEDPLDMNDTNSVEMRSLYELTIQDMRLAPYWLLPEGFLVHLDNGRVEQSGA